ncbi:hypothetical protein GGD62_008287 [Bradyrhizobium sp. ERR14]|nr:hypothetical protein [Bradyrhizobium sp. ERR14]
MGCSFARPATLLPGVSAQAILDRRKTDVAWRQQTRQPLCEKTFSAWRAILLPAFGPDARSPRKLARRAAGSDASEQGRCRPSGQDGPHCLGGLEQAWSSLRTQRSCFHLTLLASIARLGNSDDETVDQHAVSPVQKSGLRARTIYWERRARISSWPGCNRSPLARGRIHLCNCKRHFCCYEPLHGRGGPYTSAFSRLASDTSIPPNFAFHL